VKAMIATPLRKLIGWTDEEVSRSQMQLEQSKEEKNKQEEEKEKDRDGCLMM
jgi:hypothetical protein